MTDEDIYAKLKDILHETMGIAQEISKEMSLIQENVMDSMDWISFLIHVEDKFDIDIPMEEAAEHQIGYINNMIKYIQTKT